MMLSPWLIYILLQQCVAEVYTCNNVTFSHFVAAIVCTNSNQFEFERQMAVTAKFHGKCGTILVEGLIR